MQKVFFSTGLGFLALLACSIPAYAAEIHFVGTSSHVAALASSTATAYFGELNGTPATYTLNSGEPFTLHATILVPDTANATRDFSVTIRDGKKQKIATFSGRSLENKWQHWFEAWSGQWYWRGAEFKSGLPGDEYTLTVSNPKNEGAYILMIGGTDPVPDSLSALLAIEKYFGNPSALLQSRTGGLALLALILIVGFLFCRKY